MTYGYPERKKPSTPAPRNREQFDARYVRFVDQNNNPLPARHVTIKVDSATGEILDIVSEAN